MTRRLVGILAFAAACGGGDDDGAGDGDASVDGAGLDAAECVRMPSAADGVRRGVVSMPYTASGAQANTYKVFTLDAAGAITFTSTTFEMSRSFIGSVAFTPDGEIGIVAQDDGSLGVFRFESDGTTVTVLHARFQGSFYAEHVVMGQTGDLAYVIDPNTRDNDGGIYRVRIGCDDSITDEGLWIPTRSAGGIAFNFSEVYVAAREAGASSTAGDDVHIFDTPGATPIRRSGTDAFGDDRAIVGGMALTGDGRYVLVGDTEQISGLPNRVAVVGIGDASLIATQVLSPIEDPLSIVVSPFDNTALVASGFGDALVALDYDAQSATPYSVRGPLTYVGARPELPGHAVMIDRGSLRGLVLVAENLGIRRVRFAAGGMVTDLGKTATGTGTANITGAIGIQP